MAILNLLLALAPAVTSAPLTVSEAVGLAGREAPVVARARAESDRARAREKAARARLGPTLSLEAGFLSTNDPVDAFGLALKQEHFSAADFFAADPNHPGSTRDWGGAIVAAWEIDLFGAARGQARAAGQAAGAAQRIASRTRDAVAFQTVAAFAAARRAQEAIALLALRQADAEKDVDLADSLYEQGVTTAADPARARAALGETRAQTAGEHAALAAARADLAALIGSADASRPLAELPQPRELPDRGAAERDDAAAAALAARAARDGLKAASASRLPSLLFQARFEAHAPRPAGRWGDSASAFGGVRVPLFSSGGIDARIAEAQASVQAADASEREVRRAAEKEAASALAAMTAADSRLAAFGQAETAARTAREIQQARYEEGAARLSDLLEARSAELSARLGAAAAKSERAVAEARSRLALGLPPEGEDRQ